MNTGWQGCATFAAAEDITVAMYRQVYERLERPVVREPASCSVIEEDRDMLRAAISERLQAPARFILDDKALQSLCDLARQNFPANPPGNCRT